MGEIKHGFQIGQDEPVCGEGQRIGQGIQGEIGDTVQIIPSVKGAGADLAEEPEAHGVLAGVVDIGMDRGHVP